jgi:hypothetical protein
MECRSTPWSTGHGTEARTTLSIYVHVMPNDDRVTTEAMSRVFFRIVTPDEEL